jgi:hypothetical protein
MLAASFLLACRSRRVGWLTQEIAVFGVQFQLWMPLALSLAALAIVAAMRGWQLVNAANSDPMSEVRERRLDRAGHREDQVRISRQH